MSPRLQIVKPKPAKAEDTKTVHECSCRKTFTLSSWSDLPLVGFHYDVIPPEESGEPIAKLEVLEQRNCTCGSTRAIKIELPRVFLLANEQCRHVRRATSALVSALRVRGELPERDPEVTGPAELIRIEREACAQEVDKAAANLRLIASSRPRLDQKHSLFQRAELCDELATSIRSRS